MDKNRELRRSKYKKPQPLISAEESRREKKKVRRLSTVAHMASHGDEDDPRFSTSTPKKLKFPRKIFGDSNTIHPPSVPRKQRSAIRKRSCESASATLPDPKRLNNLVNGKKPLRKQDDLKKTNISTNGCLDHGAKPSSVPISKDEEEVAETLFALAGMIPLSDLHTKSNTDNDDSESKSLDLAEKPDNCRPTSGVPKGHGEEAIVTPTSNSLPSDSVQENSQIGLNPLSWPQLSERRPMNLNLKVSVPPANLQGIPPLLRACDQQINPTFFHLSTKPTSQKGLNGIKQETAFIPNSESVVRTGAVDVENQHAVLEERINNGVASRALHESGVYGLHLQSSAIAVPSWLSATTTSSRLGTCENLSTEKLSCSMNGRKTSWKRCAAHVYISRLIRVMQISEEKGSQTTSDTHPCKPPWALGGSLTMPPDYSNIVKDGTTGALKDNNMFTSTDGKNSHEGANVILGNRQHHQQQQEGPSFSGHCDTRKQSFDFLSLSSGVTSAAANGVSRPGDNAESGVRCHIRYPHSVMQRNRPITFSSPQNHYPSNHHHDQVASASVGLPSAPLQGNPQVPPYFGNPFATVQMLNMTTSAQQPQLKQQQRQQLWAAQLAAGQFRPGPLLSSHIASWQQNGRKDMQSSPHIFSSSQPTPEELRAKYLHMSQHPQMIAINQSLGPTRANHQHIQLPASHEDNGKQLHTNGVLPLQLTLQ